MDRPSRSDPGLTELESLLDLIADDVVGLGPPSSGGSEQLDPGVVAGSSAEAQENRAIHIARARSAAERARRARERLPVLVSQVRSGLERVREQQRRMEADRLGLSESLGAAMSEVTVAEHPDEALDSVLRGAVAGIPAVEMATISLRGREANVLRALASDPTAETLTRLEATLDEGPCVDVARTGTPVEVPDLAAGGAPWPAFATAAVAEGARSVLVLPLRSSYPTGSLALWSRRSHAFDETTRVLGDLFVQHASLAVANAERYRALEHAIDSRDLIGQAKGILMARRGIGADEAFRVLVRVSQNSNTKLVDVARRVADDLMELRSRRR